MCWNKRTYTPSPLLSELQKYTKRRHAESKFCRNHIQSNCQHVGFSVSLTTVSPGRMLFEMNRRSMLGTILPKAVFLIWGIGTVNNPAKLSFDMKYAFWLTYFERMNEWKNCQPLLKRTFTRNFSLDLLETRIRAGEVAAVIQWNKCQLTA